MSSHVDSFFIALHGSNVKFKPMHESVQVRFWGPKCVWTHRMHRMWLNSCLLSQCLVYVWNICHGVWVLAAATCYHSSIEVCWLEPKEAPCWDSFPAICDNIGPSNSSWSQGWAAARRQEKSKDEKCQGGRTSDSAAEREGDGKQVVEKEGRRREPGTDAQSHSLRRPAVQGNAILFGQLWEVWLRFAIFVFCDLRLLILVILCVLFQTKKNLCHCLAPLGAFTWRCRRWLELARTRTVSLS